MAYQYRPLSWERREIRVVEVPPCGPSANALLSCRLFHVSLDDIPTPRYETISYVWGNSNPPALLMVDGKELHTPINTVLALRRMALPDCSRILWIDAVCINQSDDMERSEQVALMAEIYGYTVQGLVYIGENRDWARPAFETIEALLPEIEQDMRSVGNMWDLLHKANRGEHVTDDMQTAIDKEALETLFELPWFSRVWIVQEAVLTPRNFCIWGEMIVDLESILMAAAWLRLRHANHITTDLFEVQGLTNAVNLCLARIDCLCNGGMSICNPLLQSRTLHASDGRDRVYGTLGLLRRQDRGSDPGLLTPDYTKTMRHVLQDATKQCLVTSSPFGLEMLRFICHRNNEDLHAGGFSSWTFRVDRAWHQDLDPANLPDHPDADAAFKALSKRTDFDLMGTKGLLDNISLQGTHLDDIAITSSIFPTDPGASELLGWISEVRALNSASGEKYYEERLLMRLLIAGINRHGVQSSSADFTGYTLLLEHLAKAHWTDDDVLQDTSELLGSAARILYTLKTRCKHRKAAISKTRYFLLVPNITTTGDLIVELNGSLYPFVLRPSNADFLMVGECYIDGAMPWQMTEYAEFKERTPDRQDIVFNIG